jgi:hypothetical protein
LVIGFIKPVEKALTEERLPILDRMNDINTRFTLENMRLIDPVLCSQIMEVLFWLWDGEGERLYADVNSI